MYDDVLEDLRTFKRYFWVLLVKYLFICYVLRISI